MAHERATLVIRADGGVRMGTGHLMRCLALAQGWCESGLGPVAVVTACQDGTLLQRLGDNGLRVVQVSGHSGAEDWESVFREARGHPDAWVVLDGYHFGVDYQQGIRESGHRLLVVDDMAHLEQYHTSLLLNQNLHALSLDYSCDEDTQLLLGTDYVLLRREFWRWRGWVRTVRGLARRVLVTLGGSDANNVTARTIESLGRIAVDGLETVIVVGSASPLAGAIERVVGHSRVHARVVHACSDMAALMAWADVCVSGAGSTCWELAFMGLPSVLVVLAPNQRQIAGSLDAAGVARNIGSWGDLSSSRMVDTLEELICHEHVRNEMSRRGRDLVDGRGVEGVVEAMCRWVHRVRVGP